MMLEKDEEVYGINYIPETLTEEEEKEFIKLMKKGDRNARQTLIIRNLRLVQYVARKFSNIEIEREELIGVGTIGLIKGVDTFNPDANVKFATYTSRCVNNEILMFLRNNKKFMGNISLEETVKKDEEYGNDTKIKDSIKVIDTESELYENMQYIAEVLDYILNELKNIQKICILYFAAGYTQDDVSKKVALSQSYVSRILIKGRKDLKELIKIRKKPDKRKYTIEVYNRSYYKVSLEIGEIHTYNKIREVISSSVYRGICKNNKKIEIFINSESEAMELLAEIIQIVE